MKRVGFRAGVLGLLLGGAAGFAPTPEASYRTVQPETPGPHPAVAMLSGCDGLAPPMAPALYERRTEHLRALGHVVVFVDYLGRRALKTCAGPVTHDEAARDLTAAVVWLRAQSSVDPSRITAMGWSYGARAVLVALAGRAERPPLFARAVVYYPDCRALEPWKAALPVLMLFGSDDDMTPAARCQDVARRVGAPAAVKIVVYPGARHAFDMPELSARMRYGFGTVGYHAGAAAAARTEVERFLRGP